MTTRITKIAITLSLALVLLAAFTLLYGLSDSASAPFFSFSGTGLVDGRFSDQPAVPIAHDPQDGADPYDADDLSEADDAGLEEDDSIRIKLGAPDIKRGSLVLINQDYGCEFPDERDLVEIAAYKTPSYRVSDDSLMLSGSIIEPLNAMMDAYYAETGQDTVAVISAFRDYNRQMEILNEYISLMGGNEAYKWVAVPGHSEHHSGLAVDFGVFSNGAFRTFLGTGDSSWFRQNCDKYGFILRYQEDKTDITNTENEPWHFRYVGAPHASFISQMGLCFEEYIEFIAGFSRDEPFLGEMDGESYEVYFTRDHEIVIPPGYYYDISGNNIDGFIVTVRPPGSVGLEREKIRGR